MKRGHLIDRRLAWLLTVQTVLIILISAFGPGEMLDQKLYYSADQARIFFGALTPDKHHAYQVSALIDLLFIAVYSTTSFLLLRKLFPAMPRIALFALCMTVFDLVETTGILRQLFFPSEAAGLSYLGVATSLKWLSITCVFGLMIWGFVRFKKTAQAAAS